MVAAFKGTWLPAFPLIAEIILSLGVRRLDMIRSLLLVFITLITLDGFPATLSKRDYRYYILLAEQSNSRIAVADIRSQKIVWEWRASDLDNPRHISWFSNMSDAKLVYNGDYILATASGGGVALIRISDRKAVFYTYVGGNTHSAELLPDGNIVTASSTGSYLTLIRTDTLSAPEKVLKKNIPLDFAHNVVWDRKNRLLWSAGRKVLHSYTYNFDCHNPGLIVKDAYDLPGTEGHDLFPIYRDDMLWLTNTTDVFRFDVRKRRIIRADDITPHDHIKSVSTGKKGQPVILISPKVSWWTDEVVDHQGKSVFNMPGLKIYKARWMLPVPFSYPAARPFQLCNKP